MRIVSLLPAAIDIVAELGLLANLVGRTHECLRDPPGDGPGAHLQRLRPALYRWCWGADELFANARRHGQPPYMLRLTVHRRHTLVVAIDDCSASDER